MFVYPVKLELDEQSGSYIVSCSDLLLLNSAGNTGDDALLSAVKRC